MVLVRGPTRAETHIASEASDRLALAGKAPTSLTSLIGLGQVHRMLGRHAQAAHCYQQLLALAQQLHSSNEQYEALQGLGRLHHATSQPDLALTHHQQALQLATDLTQRADQARAYDGLAYAYHPTGQYQHAYRHWQNALEILTHLGTDHTEEIEASISNIRARLINLTETAGPFDEGDSPAPDPPILTGSQESQQKVHGESM